MTKQEILEAFLEMAKTAVPTRDEFVKALGIGKNTIQKYFGSYNNLKEEIIARLDSFSPDLDPDPEEPTSTESLKDLIDVCQIDESKWKPIKLNAGYANGKVSIRGEFKPRSPVSLDELTAHFIQKVKDHTPKQPEFTKAIDGEHMLLLPITDLHLAKLDDDYDIEIAKECYRTAVAEIVDKARHYKIQKIVLIAGSDFFNTDTAVSTTHRGTYVQSEPFWAKNFLEGCNLMVEVIDNLSREFNVEVIQISGNHDRMSSYYLGQYLKAWYRTNERVDVESEYVCRKYTSWGNTLIGFTHGDGIKIQELPLIMMREKQPVVSSHKYYEWFLGHYHHQVEREIQGIKVRVTPALCSADEWHRARGYVGNIRNAQGFLYSKESGLTATFYSKPL